MHKPIYELLDNVLNARKALDKAEEYLGGDGVHKRVCQTAYDKSLRQFEEALYEVFKLREMGD